MAKEVNYTPEMVARIVDVYSAAETDEDRAQAVEDLAVEMDRKPQSIRMRLVREGVYKAKAYKAKDGSEPVTKEELVTRIAAAIGTDTELSGLERAAKATLHVILSAVEKRTETV
jgi:hypothetical protein